ncbi:MAG: CarD family transcriptional regulator [Lachnospiraceae bacterium]|nr:CarD family transcriptional regulator [Lachnospiraceae bacterium]
MFSVDDYVVCGNKGVCRVTQVATLNLSGADSGSEEYYILKPVYSPGSTVYVPTQTGDEGLRAVLSREEAGRLLEEIDGIPELEIANEKTLEQEYKVCMRSNDARDLVRLIKTISHRKARREKAGRKETALDAKYLRMAGDHLYGELSVSLEMSREDVARLFSKCD